MNLFFFGGTFDPPHLGHYSIVEKCLKLSDQVVIIPNKISLNKKKAETSPNHRLNMLKILFDNLKVEVDDFEIKSTRKNYTIHTIKYLIRKYKNFKITMVLGADQISELSHWYKYNEIINLVDILFFNREYDIKGKKELNRNCKIIEDFSINISSSKIRKALKSENGIEVKKYMDQNVVDYIRENNLYVR